MEEISDVSEYNGKSRVENAVFCNFLCTIKTEYAIIKNRQFMK